MKDRVFVAQPLPANAINLLREVADVTVYPFLDRQISKDEFIASVKRADYVVAMHATEISAEIIEANPDLKGLSICGMGDNVDLKAARSHDVKVAGSNTVALVSRATSDLTVAMILALAYRLVDGDRYTRHGRFKQEQNIALMGQGCPGKTVGLIGLGKVGRLVIPRVRSLEMNVLYTKRKRLLARQEKELGIQWVATKEDILSQSDFVCIEVDYNPSTHLLIGAKELALMKKTAYMINTARGRIVDEKALIRALRSGTIAGAALDVYWNEPPSTLEPAPDEELYQLENVILSPHNGGGTWDVRGEMTRQMAQNIVDMIKGRRPRIQLVP